LIHSERLASLGRVAAGVAHEIGNPVTGIACLAQNLRAESDDPELMEIADDILTQTERISAIVQTLVNFSHGGKHTAIRSRDNICLYDCVNEAVNLLLLDKESQPVRFLNNCDGQYLVVGNQQRLTQVFLNLLSNARDACTANQQIVIDSWLVNPATVAVAVTDPGSGIDALHQEHIWEPFFTTKEPGQGTGLGLALVYSIVEAHQGRIRVESPPAPDADTGTRFIVELPRNQQGNSADWSI
jgi:signal transduction histidine kinase